MSFHREQPALPGIKQPEKLVGEGEMQTETHTTPADSSSWL